MLKRFIGIDYGKTRIGIASGQMVTKTATPIAIIYAKQGIPNWYYLDNLIYTWLPHEFIVGLPIDINDQETEITKEARLFSKVIKKRYKKPTHLITEAFSTREARWKLEESKQKINKSYLRRVDALAACIILETWMNIN